MTQQRKAMLMMAICACLWSIGGIFIKLVAGLFLAVMFMLIGFGIVQLGIPYVLYALASRDCSPLACSLIGMLESILNPIWVLIFDGETPGFYALIGGIIVIAAVTIWCIIGEDTKEAS